MSYQSQYFKLTKEMAAARSWDIVIVGAGFGGGVLAADLFDTNTKLAESGGGKDILVIEQGNLIFHSHCLNTARPTVTGDSGQQNDAFFHDFRSAYQTAESPEWGGGPVYTLGGRSNVWGLFIPRPEDTTFGKYFPEAVVEDLNQDYFEKAEALLKYAPPMTQDVHQSLIDSLNKTPGVFWQWGRIASEFQLKQSRNFDFAEGAYSTVDKLLEIAMNNSKVAPADVKFDILLDAQVDRLEFEGTSVTGVRLRGSDALIHAKHVVLCAGSVHSAAILRRSNVPLTEDGGKTAGRLTDHDMYIVQRSYLYTRPEWTRETIGPMKLQTFTELGSPQHQVTALANISIDSSSFLGRDNHDDSTVANFVMVFVLPCELQASNDITLDDSGNPVIKIKRAVDPDHAKKLEGMNGLLKEVMDTMVKRFKVEFVEDMYPEDSVFSRPLRLGNVAHELGSLPMPLKTPASIPTQMAVVDENLELKGRRGVSVCDLSVFPVSTAANPSLTLAALALRLSAKLLPPTPLPRKFQVINDTNALIQVSVTKDGNVADERVEIHPGTRLSLVRDNNEGIFIYKDLDSDCNKYEYRVGHPGEVIEVV